MQEITEIEIPLTPIQQEIISDPHPIKVFIGGRRVGKSYLGYSALTSVGLSCSGSSVVVMPVQSNANAFYEEMSQADGFESLLHAPAKLWPFPKLYWGGTRHRLDFRAFEKSPKRLRGGNWTGAVVCDEANDLNPEDIRKIILPKLLDTGAQLYILTTITHHNWIMDWFYEGQDPKNPLKKSWKQTTPEAIWAQSDEGQQRLALFRNEFTEAEWNSECLCIPGADNSTAFPYLNQCIIDAAPPTCPQPGRRYVQSIDLARVRDFCVSVVMDDTGLVVAERVFPQGMEHSLVAQACAAIHRYWGALTVCDSTGGGGSGGSRGTADSYVNTYREFIPDIQEHFWSPNSKSKSKYDLISNLMLMTEQKRIFISKSLQTIIAQMQRYKILVAKGRQTDFGAGEGHDDAVAALAVAAWFVKMGRLGGPVQGGRWDVPTVKSI